MPAIKLPKTLPQTRPVNLVPRMVVEPVPVQPIPANAPQNNNIPSSSQSAVNSEPPPLVPGGKKKIEVPKQLRRAPSVKVVQPRKKAPRGSHGSYQKSYKKLLQQIHPDMQLSAASVEVMDCFMADIFQRLATESSTLVKYRGRKTLTEVDLHGAVGFVMPGQLARHSFMDGNKALIKFRASKALKTPSKFE